LKPAILPLPDDDALINAMLHRYDESELLDLIEGELDERAAQKLRQRLAADPRAEAAVELIMADRSALRSLEEPALPFDFMSKLEPMLARPMLMEPSERQFAARPGEFRRQYRRHTHRIRWGRLAAAAVVLLGVLAGVWAAVYHFALQPDRPNGRELARNDGPSPNAVPAPRESLASRPLATEGGTIHHYQPLPVPDDRVARSTVKSPVAVVAAGTSTGAAATSRPIVAEFAIVVQTADLSAAEQSVQRVVAQYGDQGALVRNFSFAEAQRLAEEWRLAQGRSGDGRNAFNAGAETRDWRTRADLKVLAERVRDRIRQKGTLKGSGAIGEAEIARDESSDQLAGPARLAPILEDQLELSSRGATHTIAVPAAAAAKLIEQLAIGENRPTALRMLPQAGNPVTQNQDSIGPQQAISAWLSDIAQVRRAMQRINQLPGETVVHIPVIVRADAVKNTAPTRR
jgi:hypothetical protein